jgi:phospholipid/cholesterol/gamma-HCH transport system substrate-binding protein
MLTKRVVVNAIVFAGMTALLLYIGLTHFILGAGGGSTFSITFPNSFGIQPRSDVTIRGVPAGSVESVEFNTSGTVDVEVALDEGFSVNQGTIAELTRRSPIGDITINLVPGSGQEMRDGGHIPAKDTRSPPDPEQTISVLTRVLGSVPPNYLHTVVDELAKGVKGRGEDLGSLSESGNQLPSRILQVKSQLESLIQNGPKVLDVLAENVDTLGDDITKTAILADILRDNRFELVDLSRNGANFLDVMGELLSSQKPNIACLLGDFANTNRTLAEPGNLSSLRDVLRLNHFFFDAVEQAVRPSIKDPFSWFRVNFLPPQPISGKSYPNHRPAPNAFPGGPCRSIYGPGVDADSQPNAHLVQGSRVVKS